MSGCGGETEVGHPTVSLGEEIPLHPPTELMRTPLGDLVALVAEGDQHQPVLYRAGPAGLAWQRWLVLPIPPGVTEIDSLSLDEDDPVSH